MFTWMHSFSKTIGYVLSHFLTFYLSTSLLLSLSLSFTHMHDHVPHTVTHTITHAYTQTKRFHAYNYEKVSPDNKQTSSYPVVLPLLRCSTAAGTPSSSPAARASGDPAGPCRGRGGSTICLGRSCRLHHLSKHQHHCNDKAYSLKGGSLHWPPIIPTCQVNSN